MYGCIDIIAGRLQFGTHKIVAQTFFHPFPKYLQIRDILSRRLAHEFVPGDRIPTEHALSNQFGVSRETVREALAGLEKEGLIRRQQGRGTFVVRRPEGVPSAERVTGLVEDFTELKLDTWSETLQSGIAGVPVGIARALRLEKGESSYRIRRLRSLDGKPLAHLDAYFPVAIGTRLSSIDLRKTTLMAELRNSLGLEIHEERQEVDAVVADTEMADLLGVSLGAPLLCVRRYFRDGDGSPAVIFVSHFRADRYFYTVNLRSSDRPPRGAKLRKTQ